ncbi:hypothetical protein [uncultured Deinococcus sp.]|uniref:hypothetical protein n=1 Tax=uncultured Deinococcus sp. TaxID=158789 RepID=UPI00258EB62B|nr:hypothetical protein [uncultured Deinococcus sp.]
MTQSTPKITFAADVMGRVNNMTLSKSHALLPLFETIINSIQAIEDRKDITGNIQIQILRNPLSQSLSSDSSRGNVNISGFIVTDNGIGFNQENLDSFLTADSTLKLNRGNKGVGRFLWLKAYSVVKLDSVFNYRGTLKKVSFDFTLQKPYILNYTSRDYNGDRDIGTTVKLDVMRIEYAEELPKTAKAVGRKIVEHLLTYYVTNKAPEIIIIDDDGATDIKKIFVEEFESLSQENSLDIAGNILTVKYLKNRNVTDNKNTIHLCSNRRVVKSESLEKYIPDLKTKLGEEDNYVIQGYVQGVYLDTHSNQERSQFTFPESDEDTPISVKKIMDIVSEDVKTAFASDLVVLKQQKQEKIKAFVNSKAPRYRPLLRQRYAYLLDKISPNLSEDKLEIELHKALSAVEVEIKQESAELLSKRGGAKPDPDYFKEKSNEILEMIGDVSIANLALHVIHRRLVIDLLEASLSIDDDGKYSLEESIHKIIHPLNTSSDQIHEDYQNLWLIDEKLAYHTYLASDKKLSSIPIVDSESGKEPDMLGYFDNPHAFSEGRANFQSLMIIEFKRPGRTSYSGEDNDPIRQVYNYAKLIRSGQAKDFGGRPIPNKNIPIYAYVICDFTPEFRNLAETFNDLQESYDGSKYYGYHTKLGVYIEAISFDSLVNEAKKRNKVLFDKLNLNK